MPQKRRHEHEFYLLGEGRIRFSVVDEWLPIGSAGQARIMRWNDNLQDWVLIGSPVTVHDTLWMFEGAAGDVGWAQFNADTESYEIRGPTQRWIRFELQSDRLAIGTSGQAWITRWDAEEEDWVRIGSPVTVHDTLWMFEGAGGDVGWAVFHPDTKIWEIRAPTQRRIRFELTADLAINGSASALLRRFNEDSWGTTEHAVTVWDADGIFFGESGRNGRAEFHFDSKRWEVYQLQCQEVEE